MIKRLTTFSIIAVTGLGSFVVALVFLVKGAHAELVTLVFAPVSGICFAVIMHYADIDISMMISFIVKNGRFSLTFKRT